MGGLQHENAGRTSTIHKHAHIPFRLLPRKLDVTNGNAEMPATPPSIAVSEDIDQFVGTRTSHSSKADMPQTVPAAQPKFERVEGETLRELGPQRKVCSTHRTSGESHMLSKANFEKNTFPKCILSPKPPSSSGKPTPPAFIHPQLTSFDYLKNTFPQGYHPSGLPSGSAQGIGVGQSSKAHEDQESRKIVAFKAREAHEMRLRKAHEAREAHKAQNRQRREEAKRARKARDALTRQVREEAQPARRRRRVKSHSVNHPSRIFEVGMIIEVRPESENRQPGYARWGPRKYKLPSVDPSRVFLEDNSSSTLDGPQGMKFVVVSVQPRRFIVLPLTSDGEETEKNWDPEDCISIIDSRSTDKVANPSITEVSKEGEENNEAAYDSRLTIVANMESETPPLCEGTTCRLSTSRSQNYGTKANRVGDLDPEGAEILVEMFQKFVLGHGVAHDISSAPSTQKVI